MSLNKRVADEGVRKAARRQQQIARLRAQQRVEEDARQAMAAAAGADQGPSPSLTGESAQRAVRVERSASRGLEMTRGGSGMLEANRTLQQALLGAHRDSELQHETRMAIRHSTSKAAALEAFLLLARSGNDGGGGVSAQTITEVTGALVQHHVRDELGGEAAYAVALANAVGSAEERWADVSPDEARAFALYQCQRLERHSEKGHAFSTAAGITLEGRDNEAVALVEFQLERYAREVAPVPTTALADLTHLDVSWNAALRLWETARRMRRVDPPVEMTNRVMGLMTGYRSNGIGSRPWKEALALYGRVLRSGYEATVTTHTLALDALWRSCDSFHRPANQRRVTEADRGRVWGEIVRVRANVEKATNSSGGGALRIAGDEGCAYYEGLVKAVAAAGRTDVALRLLEEMEGDAAQGSHRLLVPTAETYAFAMAASNAAGNAAHADALRALFGAHYTLRDLHSEALLVYLQSLRSVVRTSPAVGEVVEALVADGKGLDRPCAVACLQLLAARAVRPPTAAKTALTRTLFDSYDANVWLQEPIARKVELQTVMRCCYLVALHDSERSGATAEADLMGHVGRRLRSVFGAASPELEWLADTEVYGLDATTDWEQALAIYRRQVLDRPPERLKFLPVPQRQAREMLVAALLRCCKLSAANSGVLLPPPSSHGGDMDDDGGTFLFLEDGAQEEEREATHALAERCLRVISDTAYAGQPAAAAPSAAVAELQLLQALSGPGGDERKRLGVAAMRTLGLGDATAIPPRVMGLVAQTLGLTDEYVESVLVDGHAQLRGTALADLCRPVVAPGCAAVEKTYL